FPDGAIRSRHKGQSQRVFISRNHSGNEQKLAGFDSCDVTVLPHRGTELGKIVDVDLNAHAVTFPGLLSTADTCTNAGFRRYGPKAASGRSSGPTPTFASHLGATFANVGVKGPLAGYCCF